MSTTRGPGRPRDTIETSVNVATVRHVKGSE